MAFESTFPLENQRPTRAWVFYDDTCALCRAGAARFGPLLRRRGFRVEALQSQAARTLVTDTVDEMKIVTFEGDLIGGADAIAYICGRIWWARPLLLLWLIPPLRDRFRRWYAYVAARRHCLGGSCRLPQTGRRP